MAKKKIVILIIAALILLGIATSIVYTTIAVDMKSTRPTITVDDNTYYLKSNMYNVMVLGIDRDGPIENETGRLGDNGQADVIAVISVDRDAGDIKIITIPRDSIVDVDESGGIAPANHTVEEQLCLQYAYAKSSAEGAELTKTKVEELLGVKIDNYVALSFGGVADIVDFVDGVDITFSRDYTIFSKIHDPSNPHWINYYAGNTEHMVGTQVLDFVQYRNTGIDYTNLDRMDRQKDFVNAFIAKVKGLIRDDFSKATDFIQVMAPYMTTDISPTQYFDLGTLALSVDYSLDDVLKVPGEPTHWGGTDGYLVDKTGLFDMILPIYYEPKE